MALRIGVDIGGTFTDFIVADAAGNTHLWKEDSTPQAPSKAIKAGLETIAAQRGLTLERMLGEVELFVHGSTIATNAVLQRGGARVGLLCTKGFRDVVYFRDGFKWDRFNLNLPRPGDFVDRYLRIAITERIDVTGAVVTSLKSKDVEDAAAKFSDQGVEAVAVSFLWSTVNRTHEDQAVAILRDHIPHAHVVASADVLPEIREWERTSATVLSAYILPRISSYLDELETFLRQGGLRSPPLIMQVNGGTGLVADVLHKPVLALASGPAAAPAAARNLAGRLELSDLIIMDMGGTSLDVSLMRQGEPAMSRNIRVEHQPIGVAGVEVQSIGSGGGSIAWVDAGGALRVGPQSAGAAPGPACYAIGGKDPTVTDANVVLGLLSPTTFLGGRRALDVGLAADAIEREIAHPLGIGTEEAALGIVRVVNADMAAALRRVSIERGIDPRTYTLICAGGAGGLHASSLARDIGITRVIVPRVASAFCAFGMTVADVRHDHTVSFHTVLSATSSLDLTRIYSDLERKARDQLAREGFDERAIQLRRYVDARYVNQVHELTVEVPGGDQLLDSDVDAITDIFHQEHRRRYRYHIPNAAVECLHWRLSASASTAEHTVHQLIENQNGTRDNEPKIPTREVLIPTDRIRQHVSVYSISDVASRRSVAGPAIIETGDTTVVVNAGDVVSLTDSTDLIIGIASSAQRANVGLSDTS